MKEEKDKEIAKQKNSNLSVLLIFANCILLFFFTTILDRGQKLEEGLAVSGLIFIVLLGGYAFTYHGKGYRTGKWLFGIAVLAALILYGLLWYATQLGHAFAH
ncbi:hypothetical protein ACJVDH_20010 [Pedobacter sp. AW1-32]|uniref:hypothetical protein n=1 Tax=Pedobacter sp. AW1-32 TaxID=3383026 RepID=UPI003FF044D9